MASNGKPWSGKPSKSVVERKLDKCREIQNAKTMQMVEERTRRYKASFGIDEDFVREFNEHSSNSAELQPSLSFYSAQRVQTSLVMPDYRVASMDTISDELDEAESLLDQLTIPNYFLALNFEGSDSELVAYIKSLIDTQSDNQTPELTEEEVLTTPVQLNPTACLATPSFQPSATIYVVSEFYAEAQSRPSTQGIVPQGLQCLIIYAEEDQLKVFEEQLSQRQRRKIVDLRWSQPLTSCICITSKLTHLRYNAHCVRLGFVKPRSLWDHRASVLGRDSVWPSWIPSDFDYLAVARGRLQHYVRLIP